jgi:hypothetical protein
MSLSVHDTDLLLSYFAVVFSPAWSHLVFLAGSRDPVDRLSAIPALAPISGSVSLSAGLPLNLCLFAGHSVLPGCAGSFLECPFVLAFFLTWFLLAILFSASRVILFPIVGKWRILAEDHWYIVGEYPWRSVGEYPWYIVAECLWYIIGRSVTASPLAHLPMPRLRAAPSGWLARIFLPVGIAAAICAPSPWGVPAHLLFHDYFVLLSPARRLSLVLLIGWFVPFGSSYPSCFSFCSAVM